MPLARIMDTLDLIEFDQIQIEDALTRTAGRQGDETADRLLDRWTGHAVRAYLTASAEVARPTPYTLEPAREWAARTDIAEYAAYGRRYEGSGIRELRLLRHRSVHGRPCDRGEVALAAFVLATGRRVLGGGRGGKPYLLSRAEQDVHFVRVIDIGCEDASYEVRFSGTAEQAISAFRTIAEPRVTEAASRFDHQPGQDCADCPLIADCPGIAHVPGLLGVTDGPWPRRTWSMATAREYRSCHRLPLIKGLRLPSDKKVEYGEAARRGHAVHAVLQKRHGAQHPQVCPTEDASLRPDSWQAGGWEVSGAEAELGIQLLGDHHLVCPLRGLPADARILPEHTITAFDPLANVVVTAKVDLVTEQAGFWVLRETKTTSTTTAPDPLIRYPQLALNLLLLHGGALPGGSTRGRVELELLTPSGPVVVRLSPDDPAVLKRSRGVVTDLVRGWRKDTTFSPKDRLLSCPECSVARWCPDAEVGTGEGGPA
jgi:hypothetical protein